MSHISGMIRAMSAVPRVHLADPQANVREIVELLRQADAQKRPALRVSGALPVRLHVRRSADSSAPAFRLSASAGHAAASARARGVCRRSAAWKSAGRLYNCAVAVCGGRILGVVPKTHLPGSCEFYEKRWFEPGHSAPESMTLCGQTVPGRRGSGFRLRAVLLRRRALRRSVGARAAVGQTLHGRRADDRQPSASNELVTKHRYRCELIGQQRRAMPVPLPLCGRGLLANRPPTSCSPAMRASKKTGACSRRMSVLPGKAPSPSPTWIVERLRFSAARAAPSPRTRRKPCASSALSRKLLPTTACFAPFRLCPSSPPAQNATRARKKS